MKHLYLKLSAICICMAGFANAQVVTTLAGTTTAGSTNGTGAAARFSGPQGVATDGAGNVYVADQSNNQIRKIVISSGVVTTLAGSTSSGSTNATGTSARFSFPTGVVCDGSGNLYVADMSNNEIRKIVISTGVVTTLAGSTSSGSADGTGAAAGFNSPTGVASDGTNIYVADASNNEIRKIVISSGVVTTLAGNTSAGYIDGTGAAASFANPKGLVYDGSGNLFVADGGNNLIRKIVISTGVVTTFAGSTLNAAGSTDGIGTAATFYFPTGIAADANGNLYIADNFNNEIRKIIISTKVVSTVAGTTLSGSANGTGAAAGFNAPAGIASDANGVYVADRYNNEIRKIIGLVGIAQYELPTIQFSVYPNPATQVLYVKISQPLKYETTLKIMDVTGRELSIQSINKMQDIVSVDVTSLAAGTYFISMGNSKEIFVKQ